MASEPSSRRIVDALQRDGRGARLSERLGEEGTDALVQAVAEAIDEPVTTVQRRLRELEASGVLEGYEPRIDYAALGYELTAVFRIEVVPDELEAVSERLQSSHGVTDVYQVTAPDDVLAIGRFESAAAMDALLKRLSTDPGIETVRTNVVVDAIRDHDPLDPMLGD